MTEDQLRAWLESHKGFKDRFDVERLEVTYDRDGNANGHKKVKDGVTYVAQDGAKITVRRSTSDANVAGAVGSSVYGPGVPDTPVLDVVDIDEKDVRKAPEAPYRSPEQLRNEQTAANLNDEKWRQEVQDNNERSWNRTAPGGSGRSETHAERAARETKEANELRAQRQEERAQEDQRLQREAAIRATSAQESANTLANRRLDVDVEQGTANRGLTQQQINLAREKETREANKPDFLSTANAENRFITRYDPTTGQIVQVKNDNFDEVKAAAEERRKELALQIQNRQITLQEATQQYDQWFESNVKTPLMLAQEARAKAEEQRQALDAEERRRQFAANFGLEKARIGQTAAATMIQAEESLLPYRAGPTESAEMSSAINSLAAGGKINGPDAGAGVHFTPGAFEFAAPNFKQIAADAVKAAIGHLTDYKPSSQSYSTGDYSKVPSVNLSNMPTFQAGGYTYGGGAQAPVPDDQTHA